MPPERVYPFSRPLQEARFLERPNRFIGVAELNGQVVRAHIADPGRLKELLFAGATVFLSDHGETSLRKLRYSLDFVQSPEGHLVSLNTQLPNRIAGYFLQQGMLPGFEGYRLVRPEVRVGESRVDFLLESPSGQPTLLEVKSVTLVEEQEEQRLALFPDAPTARGLRHLRELAAAIPDGYEAHVLFLIQRGDAEAFSPNARTDPALAAGLKQAILEGVHPHALCFAMTLQGSRFIREVPVVL